MTKPTRLALLLTLGVGLAADARAGGFELVGHHALFSRGMNAAIAIHGRYAYIGSRTDGSPHHPHPGVLVVDIANPRAPQVVGEIGPPEQGNPGETSRELRVWPDANLLLVLNFGCSPRIHDCAAAAVAPTIRFYDIGGANAADPRLVATYYPSRVPHEFFLWQDPGNRRRVLLFMSTPSFSRDNLLVTDVSRARAGLFREIATWNPPPFPDGAHDDRLHSLSVSNDGRRAYLAYLTAGFFVIDTSDVADGVADPEIRLLAPLAYRARWPGPGAHSAVKLWGREYALITDEVYGTFTVPTHGCPWGWARIIDLDDVDDDEPLEVASEYKLSPFNDANTCDRVDPQRNARASFSTHNPTVTPNLAFITWHSAGLQAISIADPEHPKPAGEFLPAPLAEVATEDPALSAGPDKVVMWSYPVIRDGLIYVVDLRNGLYVLRYTGVGAAQVARIRLLDGNSNLGDALRFERP